MTFAEFFAGIGLMRLGLERAGWECAFANDIDADKRDIYALNFDASHFRLCDIHDLEPRDIPTVDLATASFPCTDLSLAGGRAGLAGRHSSAVRPFLELLDAMGDRRSAHVLLENVVGFLTSRDGKDLEFVAMELNRLGYLVDALIVDAERFVPQSRQRLFLIGRQGSASLSSEPTISAVRPQKLCEFVAHRRRIQWGFAPAPDLPRRAASVKDILDPLPSAAKQWWNEARVEKLIGQMSPAHQLKLDEMRRSPKPQAATAFRRMRDGRPRIELRTDGVAGCLRTPKGGSAKQIVVIASKHGVRARLLTPRECARLMGANDFNFGPSDQRALFGFGDAVAVPVIEWIARELIEPHLAGHAPCLAIR